MEGQAHLTAARRPHILHLALAERHLLHHHAGIAFIHVNQSFFEGFFAFAGFGIVARQYAWAADGQFKAFTAHLLNQDAKLQFTAASHFKSINFFADLHFDRDIAFGFLEQPIADLARRDLLALTTTQGAVIDAESHGERRRVHRNGRQRFRHFGGSDGIRNGGIGKPGNGDDIARLHFFHRHTIKARESHELGQAASFHNRPILAQHAHRHIDARNTLFHPPGQNAAQEIVAFQDGGIHREGLFQINLRRRHMGQDQVKQRRKVFARAFQLQIRPTLPARSKKGLEIKLLIRCTQSGEKVEDLVMHLIRAGILAVHLIDDHNRLQPARQGLGQHEFRLRQRAFGGVAQNNGAIHHGQNALNLTAEIGVAGRVHNVDLHTLPFHGGGFGKDGDAAFAFQIIAVQRAFRNILIGAEGTGLAQ